VHKSIEIQLSKINNLRDICQNILEKNLKYFVNYRFFDNFILILLHVCRIKELC